MENRANGTWISRQSIMEPADVAAIAIRKLLEKKALIITGSINQIFLFLNRIIPSAVKERLLEFQVYRSSSFSNG